MVDILRSHFNRHITLTVDEFRLAAAYFHLRRLKKRQYLLQQGDVCRYESYVIQGCLKSYYTDWEGHDHVLQISTEDWWAVDLKSFVLGTPAAFNIEAIEPTTVLQIDQFSLEELYRQVPQFERFFRILNQNSLIAVSQRLIDNHSLPARERYQLFLQTYPHLIQRAPLKDIASYLGITPVFLSQLRKELAAGLPILHVVLVYFFR